LTGRAGRRRRAGQVRPAATDILAYGDNLTESALNQASRRASVRPGKKIAV
jgi:hypothetical protein